jgi:hypothetical protein
LVIILRKHFGIAIENMEDGKRIFQTLGTLHAHIAQHRAR